MQNHIATSLKLALSPKHIEISDFSASHAGHDGALPHGSHINITIVADVFCGKRMVERHRMVYKALQKQFEQGLHAVIINPFTTAEYEKLHTYIRT